MSYQLELVGITKAFNGIKAIDDVCVRVRAGEVTAIVGENGAGKSTLMNIIYGLLAPDAGSIVWQGRECLVQSPTFARQLGIGIVMQHFSLFTSMTVLENLYLHATLSSKITLTALTEKATATAQRFGFELDLHAQVDTLSVGEQQRLEILRCLLQDNLKLLILDEPTAVLTTEEADALLVSIKKLASSGCAIVYISHKLREVKAIANDIVVLRHGKIMGSYAAADCDEARIAELMVGEPLTTDTPVTATHIGAPLLSLQQVSTRSGSSSGAPLKNIELELRAGEVVGIAGVSGNGQNALVDVISGEVGATTGAMTYLTEDISGKDLPYRYRQGLTAVAAERLARSTSVAQTLVENMYLKYRLTQPGFSIDWRKMEDLTQQVIVEFDVRCAGPHALAKSLSGGNLQKFIIGRELLFKPRVLVCHQPTWGVDIKSALFIRKKLQEIASEGASVLVISEDIDELYSVSQKIGVLYEGTLSELKNVADFPLSEMGQWLSGLQVARQNTVKSRAAHKVVAHG